MSPQTNTSPVPEVIGDYTVHPVASLLPKLEGAARDELKQSLLQHGQQQPIVVKDGVLWDGRNRLEILLELGKEPVIQEYAGTLPPAEFILAANVHRRHLTDTQRAAIGVDILHWQETQQAKQRQAHRALVGNQTKSPANANERKASARIADKVKVSRDRVEQVIKVKKHAPELMDSLKSGKMELPDAKKVVSERSKAEDAELRNLSRKIEDSLNEAFGCEIAPQPTPSKPASQQKAAKAAMKTLVATLQIALKGCRYAESRGDKTLELEWADRGYFIVPRNHCNPGDPWAIVKLNPEHIAKLISGGLTAEQRNELRGKPW
jgi:ParB-like chromosome segregation protein Spo0J